MNISISYVSISFTSSASGSTAPVDGSGGAKPAKADPRGTVGSEVSQRAHDLNDLRHALKAGNLDDARKAFASLQKDLQNVSDKNGKNPFAPDTKLGKDLAAIGTALESGDLSAAKQSFRALTHDMRSAHRAHHHHHHHHDGDDTSSSTTTTTPTTPVTTPTTPVTSTNTSATGTTTPSTTTSAPTTGLDVTA